jgi:hypothetical protein
MRNRSNLIAVGLVCTSGWLNRPRKSNNAKKELSSGLKPLREHLRRAAENCRERKIDAV